MCASGEVRIEIDAARALARWKSRFADDVCEVAKRLAAESGQPNRVTLTHYRQAAEIALGSLSKAIHGEDEPDGQKKAA